MNLLDSFFFDLDLRTYERIYSYILYDGYKYVVNKPKEEFKMDVKKYNIGDLVVVNNCNSSLYGTVGRVIAYDYAKCLYHVSVLPGFIEAMPGNTLVFSSCEIELLDVAININPAILGAIAKARREFRSESIKQIAFNLMKYGSILESCNNVKVKNIKFNGPATIVFWTDNTKTIVKADGEDFDHEKGIAMAIAKKFLGTNSSKSNYYDIFKKYLPKDEKEEVKPDIKEEKSNEINKSSSPCDNCSDRKSGCLTNCQKMQDYVNAVKEDPKPEPIEPGYFIKHSEERKNTPKPSITPEAPTSTIEVVPVHISTFVNKFNAAMYPAEFISFCKQHMLYFYIVDNVNGGFKKVDPFKTNWQSVTGYLKRGLMVSCKKIKLYKTTSTSFMAVKMDEALFSRMPRKEEK